MNLAQYIASIAENTHLGNIQSCRNCVIVSPFANSIEKIINRKPDCNLYGVPEYQIKTWVAQKPDTVKHLSQDEICISYRTVPSTI